MHRGRERAELSRRLSIAHQPIRQPPLLVKSGGSPWPSWEDYLLEPTTSGARHWDPQVVAHRRLLQEGIGLSGARFLRGARRDTFPGWRKAFITSTGQGQHISVERWAELWGDLFYHFVQRTWPNYGETRPIASSSAPGFRKASWKW